MNFISNKVTMKKKHVVLHQSELTFGYFTKKSSLEFGIINFSPNKCVILQTRSTMIIETQFWLLWPDKRAASNGFWLFVKQSHSKKNNTKDSNVVPHRSTSLARQCLTSLSRREAVL